MAFLLVGCVGSGRKPLLSHRGGGVSAFKRIERHAERDFIHHITRQAYRRMPINTRMLSPEQLTIVEAWGEPDYVRKPFRSLDGEKVREWIYLEDRTLFQFVGGEVAYEGPLTDFEDLLIRYGYPDHLVTTVGETGIVRTVMVYRHVFGGTPLATYNLHDGQLVQIAESD